jgi:hypothetical protein
MFPHRNFHKYTWTAVDEQTHNHNDHVLIYFSEELTVILTTIWWLKKVRDSPSVISKKGTQKLDVKELNLNKLSEMEFREGYLIKISNNFAALEELNDSENIHTA